MKYPYPGTECFESCLDSIRQACQGLNQGSLPVGPNKHLVTVTAIILFQCKKRHIWKAL